MRVVAGTLVALFAGAAGAAVVGPLPRGPDLRAVADRVHGLTVFVSARTVVGNGTVLSTASGVLIGGGLVLTDLHGLVVAQPGGALVQAADIVVLTDAAGPVPAVLAGGDLDVGVAVLRLPQDLPGAAIARSDAQAADPLLAMGTDGKVIDVLGVTVEHAAGARLRTEQQLPAAFRGGPLFDERGDVAAIDVWPGRPASASALLRVVGDVLSKSVPP